MSPISEPRPNSLTPELALICAGEMVDDLQAAGLLSSVGSRGQAIADIVRHAGANDDGYALAKELDDRAHWPCDFAICEALDGWGFIVSKHIKAAQRAWAERNAIEPPYAIGERIAFRWGCHAAATGTIARLSSYRPAAFEVSLDDNPSPNSFALIDFEDARPAPTPEPVETEAADACR